MPVISPASLLHTLVDRGANLTNATTNTTTNAAAAGLPVVCAWPVSGQYGVGSRVLYYVLVAACVFARKAEWLRNACLAAALLFPAVAAFHGIALAALHVNGAVDMDVYGAFQLCSIGILAAPVTVRLSRTYFYDPGRNTIFLWTGLILAGLLSLAVEFFRLQPTPCPTDDAGTPISNVISQFPYNVTCGLTCNVTSGPFSPMRGGSANNIYVIPAPDKLTFGAATLLAAACCIPAILSMVSMWNKILEINWKTRFEEPTNEPIEGTNGATVEKMKGINSLIRSWLSAVEIPVFGLAVLAILIVGEMNFFSHQLRYQSEPMAAIGQWAPMVGTALAVLGSLYLLLAAEPEAKKDEATPDASPHPCHCNCSMQQVGTGPSAASSHSVTIPVSASMRQTLSNDTEETSIEIVPTTSQPAPDHGHPMKRSWTIDDAGYRRKVANSLTELANYVGTAAPNRFDISEFRRGRAVDFPEIPGEEHRNRALPQIREQYNQTRDADGYITPVGRESRSRASSFNDSIASGRGIGGSTTPRSASPQPPHSSRSPSPVPSLTIPRRPHASTFPVLRTSFEQPNSPSSPTAGSSGVGLRPRRDTLEVPSPTHRSTSRNGPSALSISSAHNVPQGMSSPTIVVSSDPDTSPAHTPISSAPTPPSPSEYPPSTPTATLPPSS